MRTIGFVVFSIPDDGLPNGHRIEPANLSLDELDYEANVLSEASGLVSASASIRVAREPFGEAVFMSGRGRPWRCSPHQKTSSPTRCRRWRH
jgi:hypothetical protein